MGTGLHELDAFQAAARMMRERESDCVEWGGCKDRYGYGRIKRGGKNLLAHRVAYEDAVGPIPDGMTIDHLCRNRSCVNPGHLDPVPLATNIMRGDGVGVRNFRKTHCKRGHEFSPENTYLRGSRRVCRECGREATRRWRGSG